MNNVTKMAAPIAKSETATQGNEALSTQSISHTLIEIIDDLCEPKRKIGWAHLMLDEMTQDYFDKYDNENKDDRLYIAWDYNFYRTKADIANLSVREAEKALEQVQDKLDILLSTVRERPKQ